MQRAPWIGRVCLCAWFGAAGVARAEGPATLTGRITDPSGLAVANSAVSGIAAAEPLPVSSAAPPVSRRLGPASTAPMR